jgi:predicted nucleic acid-binding protein
VIVVDTGVLYALADRRDTHHARCLRWLATCTDELLVPSWVVAEACYLIGSRCGAEVEAAPSRASVWEYSSSPSTAR